MYLQNHGNKPPEKRILCNEINNLLCSQNVVKPIGLIYIYIYISIKNGYNPEHMETNCTKNLTKGERPKIYIQQHVVVYIILRVRA